jgi:SHS2 domain-containing protein
MSYKFIEHTSDIIIEAKGSSFIEAFESLASGMFTQMGEGKPTDKFEIEVEARTLEILVVNTLSEILAEVEIRGVTPAKLKIERFDKDQPMLIVSVYGEKKAPKNIIKAVTFHELILKEDKNKREWTIRVLFDI